MEKTTITRNMTVRPTAIIEDEQEEEDDEVRRRRNLDTFSEPFSTVPTLPGFSYFPHQFSRFCDGVAMNRRRGTMVTYLPHCVQ